MRYYRYELTGTTLIQINPLPAVTYSVGTNAIQFLPLLRDSKLSTSHRVTSVRCVHKCLIWDWRTAMYPERQAILTFRNNYPIWWRHGNQFYWVSQWKNAGKRFFFSIALFCFCFLVRQDGGLWMLCRLRAEVKIVRNERVNENSTEWKSRNSAPVTNIAEP